MNPVFVFALAMAAAVAVVSADGEKYTDKYDNVDLDEILANERLYKKYLECLLGADEKGCTPDGKELRKNIPDALTNECNKCTEKQRTGTDKVIKHMRDNKPADWEKLQAKWDPEGLYLKKLAEKVAA